MAERNRSGWFGWLAETWTPRWLTPGKLELPKLTWFNRIHWFIRIDSKAYGYRVTIGLSYKTYPPAPGDSRHTFSRSMWNEIMHGAQESAKGSFFFSVGQIFFYGKGSHSAGKQIQLNPNAYTQRLNVGKVIAKGKRVKAPIRMSWLHRHLSLDIDHGIPQNWLDRKCTK